MISFDDEVCVLSMLPNPPDNLLHRRWCSDPIPSLLKLDPQGITQVVECHAGEFFVSSGKEVHWWCIIKQQSSREDNTAKQSSLPRTLEKLSVGGGAFKKGMLDRKKTALLMHFLSGTITRACSLIQLQHLFISAGVNTRCFPLTTSMEFEWCTFEADSRFFKQPSSSELSRHTTDKKEEFDFKLSFINCYVPNDLDISFLKNIPRIAFVVQCSDEFTMTPLEWLKTLQSQLVQVNVTVEINVADMLELYVTSYCTLLEQSIVLTSLYWKFDFYHNAYWNARMKPEQQKKLFDAAGKAASPVLHSLDLHCNCVSFFHSKNEILKYHSAS